MDSIYDHNIVRVGAVTPHVYLADPAANAHQMLAAATDLHQQGAALAVFPEMSLTGYSVGDLVHNQTLQDATVAAIQQLVRGSRNLFPVIVVGAPLVIDGELFNCALAIHNGKVLGITPKTHLADRGAFDEARYFATLPPSETRWVRWDPSVGFSGSTSQNRDAIPFGPFVLKAEDLPDFHVAMEVSEDVWTPTPPSSENALAGATVIANLSASPSAVGAAKTQETVLAAQSLATLSAYVYSSAGYGESTTDLAWDGAAYVYEAGQKLASARSFTPGPRYTVADVDLDLLAQQRIRQTSFQAAKTKGPASAAVPTVGYLMKPGKARHRAAGLLRPAVRFPFLTDKPAPRTLEDVLAVEPASTAETILDIQVNALVRRMTSIGNPKLILGVSGGLDSTLALLVAVRAMETLGRPLTDIIGYTLPGFGTTEQSMQNAYRLGEATGVTFETLDIRATASAMLESMGHPFAEGQEVYDLTFENVQAGLRTDLLFRLAGMHGGIVVGTGDMSELALGWCTFGVGDHMSHYGVNAGVPKTGVKFALMSVAADAATDPTLADALRDVLGMEISPELVPPSEDAPVQSTEAEIGPYELQDFTLYHVLGYGYSPSKIFFLARAAWGDKYSSHEILRWLGVFHSRFFSSQYKRSTLPDGPKVMQVGSLSPRGSWQMPTDALSVAWLAEIDGLSQALARTQDLGPPEGFAHVPAPAAAQPPARTQMPAPPQGLPSTQWPAPIQDPRPSGDFPSEGGGTPSGWSEDVLE